MSDYLFDCNDSPMNLDGPNNGIPIPRSQHSQSYQRPDFENQGYIFYHDSPSPNRPPLVPPNSLSMGLSSQFIYNPESQRHTLSPLTNAGSPFMMSNSMDDVEIKMEPFEELLDIGGGGMNSSDSHQPLHEDNLLDNVNFEDLLMTDDMDSSTTTCLDPQHSSPAAMATVHPDEVLGLMKGDYTSHLSQSFSPTINVPVKSENVSFGGLATSFPPQGIGWKDSTQPQSVPNRTPFYNTAHHQLHRKENPHSPQLQSRIIILQNEFMNDSDGQQKSENDLSMPYNNNEPLYTQLDSASSASANSTLHDLLINSPSLSHSPQHLHQQQLSPFKSNMSSSPLRGMSPQDIPIGQSVPGPPSFLTSKASYISSRLSSSAPVNNFSFEQIWQRREPRQHLLSTGSLAEEAGGSTSSLSTGGGILSPSSYEFDGDSDEDSEHDQFDSGDSDNESTLSEEMASLNGSQSSKKERHFWQYNVQAKGPKGHRVNITQNETDPHMLDKIMDPVFSPLCSIQGIKHSGKARRGDGNDLTPSPRKLVSIGMELNKLNKKINEMTPVSELPSTVRSKSRKEKNKLASRACRLKKKAQHEANKIKLHGLEQEHKGMLSLIAKTKDDLLKKIELTQEKNLVQSSSGDSFLNLDDNSMKMEESDEFGQTQQILTGKIEKSAKMRTRQRIAGFTTEFVNKVIENCRSGNSTGGLDELAQTFVKTSSPTESEGLNFNNELYT